METVSKKKRKISITVKILIGFILGIAAGLIFQNQAEFITKYINPIGTLFINLIKMVIVPLVFTSLVVGASGLGDIKKMGRVGGKTIAYFLATTAFAVILGLIIGNLFGVGKGFQIEGAAEFTPPESTDTITTLLNIIPTNPINALATGNMLQIIAFALFIGGGITIVGKAAEPVKHFFEGAAEVMYKIVGGIMILAPYAVFCLMTNVIAINGPKILGAFLVLILAVYLACIAHAVIVYSSTVKLLGKYSPIKFFKHMIPAMTFAFTTASSSATLPFTMESSRKHGVSLPIRSFVLPLGATINMDGTAAFQGICALFIAHVYGLNLSILQQLQIVLLATLASIGTAGVPGAGTVMLGMVLTQVGLPIEGVGLIMGVDRILDMIRTTINITGDAACAVIVARSEKELSDVVEEAEPVKTISA